MAKPVPYQIAKAFSTIKTHPAFPFLDEKWKGFAELLIEKDVELSPLPDKKFAKEYTAYIKELSGETPKSAFEKYVTLLKRAAKAQLAALGYSESQVGRLYSTEESKKALPRILQLGISADRVSVGPSGKLTVIETAVETGPLAVSLGEEAGTADFMVTAARTGDLFSREGLPVIAESIMDAASSIEPGMDADGVREAFGFVEIAFYEKLEEMEEAGLSGEALDEVMDKLSTALDSLIVAGAAYATQPAPGPETSESEFVTVGVSPRTESGRFGKVPLGEVYLDAGGAWTAEIQWPGGTVNRGTFSDANFESGVYHYLVEEDPSISSAKEAAMAWVRSYQKSNPTMQFGAGFEGTYKLKVGDKVRLNEKGRAASKGADWLPGRDYAILTIIEVLTASDGGPVYKVDLGEGFLEGYTGLQELGTTNLRGELVSAIPPWKLPAPVPVPVSGDTRLEEELLEKTDPVSEDVMSLAMEVVALAHEANRPTSFPISEIAQELVKSGAPDFGNAVIGLLDNPQAMGVQPVDMGDRVADSVVGAGEKAGVSGVLLSKLGEVLRTSLPSSVMRSANGILLGIQGQSMAVAGGEEKLAEAANNFEAENDVQARVAVFEFTVLVAKVLADAGASPKMPAQIIGVERPVEPTGIIASGPDPEGVRVEAEIGERGYVPPPVSSKPTVDTTIPGGGPSVGVAVPSQGQLIELIAATRGDAIKYLPLIADTYNGYGDVATIAAALQAWFKGLLSQPNNSFIIRWTTAQPPLDIAGSTPFATTHQLSAGADGNQPPNGAMWRKVAVPVALIQKQTRAYIESGAFVKTAEQYEVEFAGASLQGPPQVTVGGVPEDHKSLYYYITATEFGVAQVHVTRDVYEAILSSNAFTASRPDEEADGVADSVVEAQYDGGMGSWFLEDHGDLYLVNPELSETPDYGLLVLLEKYGLAACGSVMCVSAFLTDEAEGGETTVSTIIDGASALTARWKTAFASVLQTEVTSVHFGRTSDGGFKARVTAGTDAYPVDVYVMAVVGENNVLSCKVYYRVNKETLFEYEEQGIEFHDLIGGTHLATMLESKAMEAGVVLEPPTKVVTIPGDGLSSDEFSSIIATLVSETQAELKSLSTLEFALSESDSGASESYTPPPASSRSAQVSGRKV